MTKKIQAYFESEDKALNVQTKLLQYDVKNMEIGVAGGSYDSNTVPIIPFVGGNTGTSGSGVAGIGCMGAIPGGFIPSTDDIHDSDGYNIVLSGEIKDELYKHALELIKDNHGHIAAVNEV